MLLKVEDGALTETPCYETHSRGKNWLAVIASNPTAPNGLGRTFQEKARGRFYYMISGLSVGDPVEFGADYYTGGGNPQRTRFYGIVRAILPDGIEIEEFETAKKAIDAAKQKDRPSEIKDRLIVIEAEIARLCEERKSLMEGLVE